MIKPLIFLHEIILKGYLHEITLRELTAVVLACHNLTVCTSRTEGDEVTALALWQFLVLTEYVT